MGSSFRQNLLNRIQSVYNEAKAHITTVKAKNNMLIDTVFYTWYMKKTTTKLFIGFVVLAALGAGIYGAFSATVSSTGNEFETGSLALDGGNGDGVAISPVYYKTNAVPGDSGATATSCPLIQNTGSVNVANGDFRVYAGALTGTPDTDLTDEINVTIERGTGSNVDCTGFTPAATIYTGTLTDFQTTKNSWAAGIDTGIGLNASASQRFRISTTLSATAPNTVQGKQSGTQAVTWEVRS